MQHQQQMALLQQQRAAQAARAQQQQQQQMAALATGRGAALPGGARQMTQEQRAMQAAALQQEYQRLVQEVLGYSQPSPSRTGSLMRAVRRVCLWIPSVDMRNRLFCLC